MKPLDDLRAAIETYDNAIQDWKRLDVAHGSDMAGQAEKDLRVMLSGDTARALLEVAEAAIAFIGERDSIRIEDISDKGLEAYHTLNNEVDKLKG